LVRTNHLSGQIIGALDDKARNAGERAQVALEKGGNALAHAAAAADKSAEAEESASNAVNLARAARKEVNSFAKEMALARKELTDAQRAILQTNADLGKVQKRVADRHLTPEQQSRIAPKLCQFGGRNVRIGLYNSDGEMQNLAKDIKGALPQTCVLNLRFALGWAVSISPYQVTEGFSGIHIFLMPSAGSQDRVFAASLREALKEAGLDVDGPMPPPQWGSVIAGGGNTETFIKGVPGAIEGTSVEIAIGKKP
jgi:hypothetical protein